MNVEVQLHSFLTLALDGDELSNSHPSCFSSRKEPWHTMKRRLGGAPDSLLVYFSHSLLLIMKMYHDS